MDQIYSYDLNEADNLEVAYFLENASDIEICKAADQGNTAANFIFHSMWNEERRKSAASKVDKQWQDQWKI